MTCPSDDLTKRSPESEPAERKPHEGQACESCHGLGKFYPSTNEPGELAEPCDCDECDGTGVASVEPEPVERKPHEGRVYGEEPYETVTINDTSKWQDKSAVVAMAAHLRDLLDERKAIEALAEAWTTPSASPTSHAYSSALRKVLNGKQ
jgi:hypothetical protein